MSASLSKKTRAGPNLEAAWRVIQRNGQSSNSIDVRSEIADFAVDPITKLNSLKYRLSRGKFAFGMAKGVPIKKIGPDGKPTGKIRPIVLAPLETRIVQRAILNILTKLPEMRSYFDTPFSFGGIRKVTEEANSVTAVPGAIAAIRDAIASGATFAATADIAGFFTKIPKPVVRKVVADVTADQEFMALFDAAVNVELHNLDLLSKYRDQFPIEDIGVAQGNSLSPLLGNIILNDFDRDLNTNDCRCIRYIDDFIILGPSAKAVNAKLAKARKILAAHNMLLETAKSDSAAIPIDQGLEFLGIEICPGIFRPDARARARLLERVDDDIKKSLSAMKGIEHGNRLDQQQSLIFTLRRIEGRLNGWRKHYWFCNDYQCFFNLNAKIGNRIQSYLGRYSDLRSKHVDREQRQLLGLTDLTSSDRAPFNYPTKRKVIPV